jgi:hypothetical protein
MVHLILGINFGFWALQCFFTNFIIYIQGYMGIFMVVIGIIGPLSHFDYCKIKASLVIKIINFNQVLNMVQSIMLVIFHMNVITCQIFNLPNIYRIFVRKPHFLR